MLGQTDEGFFVYVQFTRKQLWSGLQHIAFHRGKDYGIFSLSVDYHIVHVTNTSDFLFVVLWENIGILILIVFSLVILTVVIPLQNDKSIFI